MEKVEAMKMNAGTNPRDFSIYRVWGDGGFVHICLESTGCRFRRKGYCMMCDYGAGRCITPTEAVCALESVLNRWPQKIERLLLGSCGSVFDPAEITPDVLQAILSFLQANPVPHLIFETHYTTVTPDILAQLKDFLPQQEITIEMGFESASTDVLHSLHKFMNLSDLKATMDRIHAFGMSVSLNVFLGAPHLTQARQIEDALQSIRWAFRSGADEVVLFPANIKPGTKLWTMYRVGTYRPVTHDMVLAVLDQLSDRELSGTSVSWYGDRQEAGEDTDIVPPYAEETQRSRYMDFYRQFMKSTDAAQRKKLLAAMRTEG